MLRLKGTDAASAVRAARDVTRVTQGVVTVDVSLGDATTPPFHWRAGLWTKPPLDVAVDPEAGTLRSVQVVIQDERVDRDEGVAEGADIRRGNPIFNTSEWAQADRYLDNTVPVDLTRTPDGRLQVLIGRDREPRDFLCVDDQLCLAFGRENELIAIVFGPLSRDEWSAIEAADTAPPI